MSEFSEMLRRKATKMESIQSHNTAKMLRAKADKCDADPSYEEEVKAAMSILTAFVRLER